MAITVNQALLQLIANNSLLIPIADKMYLQLNILMFNSLNLEHQGTKLSKAVLKANTLNSSSTSLGNQLAGAGISITSDILSNKLTDGIFGDSELGRGLGTLFSSGISSSGNTIANNLIKGEALTQGLGKNVGSSLAGVTAGLVGQGLGAGINALGGDSVLSRGLGAGVATGVGTIGGQVLSNLVSTGKALGNLAKGSSLIGTSSGKLFSLKSGIGLINPVGLAGLVVGSALGAMTGPSKEYGGKYGNITQTMDTVYDIAQAGVNFIPGVGQGISGLMALNKGLSNIFGSTDGMTKTDAILGSAFMPAPVKWLNMWGATKTGTFNNLSWQNSLKVNSFMGDAFGNLSEKFDKARDEAGKTYGTFSQNALREALRNINFANYAWERMLALLNLNEYQNIRSLAMSSINNLRYAQDIQGGWNPIYRGKQGMKIFNNATNHNIGMRLLSAAALIDNKQMILSAQGGTKVMRPRKKPHRKGEQPVYTEEELKLQAEWNAHLEKVRKQQAEEQARKQKQREEAADKFNQQTSTVMGVMTLQANETPFTGQEYQQAAENLRQEKVEKFHEKAEELGKGFEAAMMADLAVGATPLFRWAFNKAGLLVKVPLEKTNLFLTSPYTGKWTQFGNREYRLKPGYVGVNGVPVESRTLKITPENATNMTPEQWTAAQDAAIARGDMAEAQRLSDLHSDIAAKKEGFTVYNTYRSQKPNDKYKWENKSPYDDSRYGIGKSSGYFTTDSEPVARTYKYTDDSPLFNLNIYMKNPYIKDIEGRSWQFADTRIAPNGAKYGVTTDEIINKVKPEGVYDGVIFKNIVDVGAFRRNLNGASDVATDYVSFPGRAKLRDAVTYNNGVRIPLGKRHNFNINDIRYSWLPWFLGGSTAATLYNNSK